MINLDGIKNIIFDLGVVILDIAPQNTVKALKELGLPDLVAANGLSYHHEVFYKMERGQISNDEFRNGIRSLLSKPASDKQIDNAWTAMLLDIPAERVKTIQELKSKYRIFLFSNTNAIHVEKFQADFKKDNQMEFSSLFEKDFYSNEIGLRKPDIESYQKVIELAGINPEETLFIDDSKDNIEGAQKAGLKGFWLQPDMELAKVFENIS